MFYNIKEKNCQTFLLVFRKGWKIMSDSGEILDSAALKTVVGMIKDIEYQVEAQSKHNFKSSYMASVFIYGNSIT